MPTPAELTQQLQVQQQQRQADIRRNQGIQTQGLQALMQNRLANPGAAVAPMNSINPGPMRPMPMPTDTMPKAPGGLLDWQAAANQGVNPGGAGTSGPGLGVLAAAPSAGRQRVQQMRQSYGGPQGADWQGLRAGYGGAGSQGWRDYKRQVAGGSPPTF